MLILGGLGGGMGTVIVGRLGFRLTSLLQVVCATNTPPCALILERAFRALWVGQALSRDTSVQGLPWLLSAHQYF